jgi:hypothetical protein
VLPRAEGLLVLTGFLRATLIYPPIPDYYDPSRATHRDMQKGDSSAESPFSSIPCACEPAEVVRKSSRTHDTPTPIHLSLNVLTKLTQPPAN